jgi:hypothetical protein
MSAAAGATWSIDDIPYGTLVPASVRDDRRLFEIVASASFIEITSDLYTKNLVEFFAGDGEVAEWLAEHWQREELQHGAALRKYVETAWPDFDWEAGYRLFLADYGPTCTVARLAATKALEMASRCVIETGTATFYRALSDLSPEPVLKRLAGEISADEVRHYKHFHRYFLRFSSIERPSRLAVLRTLFGRAADVEAEDTFYAYKAVFGVRHPAREFRRSDYNAWRDGVVRLMRDHVPHGMAVKMLLKPLGLSPLVGRAMLPAITSATRLFISRYNGIAGGTP